MDEKQDPTICCLNISFKDAHRFKVKGQKKRVHASETKNRAEVAILKSDFEIDFMPKAATRDKESHYTMIKGLTHQELWVAELQY